MSPWHWKRRSIVKALFDGHIVPAKNLEWVQPVDGRQCVQFVQAGHNSPVFNVGQPADMQNEFWTPSAGGPSAKLTPLPPLVLFRPSTGFSLPKTRKDTNPSAAARDPQAQPK